MKTKIGHGGASAVYTEYEVRELDEHGDAQDVRHYESKREAMAAANKLAAIVPAVVVEKHVSKCPAHLFAEPSKFTTVATMGKRNALKEGGWIE